MKALWFPLSILATGVAVGLLIAPEKGKDTRRKIGRRMDDMKVKWKKWKGETTADLEELKDRFSHEIDGLEDDVRERVLRIIETSRPSKIRHKDKELMA